MTAAVTELNPGLGGSKVLHDTLTLVDGAAAPSGAVAQAVKLAYGSQGNAEFIDTGKPLPVTEPAVFITGEAARTAVVNNIIPATAGASGTDVANYRSAAVQVVSTGTGGTFIFEQSNDGTNWIALPVFNAALTTGAAIVAAITATASQIVYTVPLRCRFLRLRIATTITGGSIQAFTKLSTEPWTPHVAAVAQPTAANLNVTATLPAGTNAIGDVGLQFRANATGAASTSHIVSTAGTNAANVKASAGRVVGWSFVNTTASYQYVKLHNTAGAPTAGSGVVQTIAIPPNGVNNMPVGGAGIAFTTGIARTIVTGSADTDATATTAGAVVGDLFFA